MKLEFLKNILQIAESYILADESVPVLAYKSPQALQEEISIGIDEKPMDESAFLKVLEQVIMATPKTASKGFYNQLYGGRHLVGLGGEILASVCNNSMYTYKVGGIQILIEEEVVNEFLQKVGFLNGEGTFASGGSMTNLMAMLAARHQINPTIRNKGYDGKNYITYVSEEGHYSISKNAGIIGLGRHNVRKIAADGQGRMIVSDLEKNIQIDLQDGNIPFLVVGTAGTTVLGAFDPFEEIAEIAQKYAIWFHIDGAYGGSALLSQKHKHLVKGSQKADSFSWNAHKMMSVPLTASVILFKEKGILHKNMSEHADYLFQTDGDEYNPGQRSLQCGRRNDALKVWSMWKFLGRQGYEQRIDKLFELARYAAQIAQNDPEMELILEPPLTTVCFEVLGKSNEQICEILDKRGISKVGYGKTKSRTFIRLSCVNPDIGFEDIDLFFEQIRQISKELETIKVL